MSDTRPDYVGALSEVFDAATINIERFRTFPVVVDRLRQLKAGYALSPPGGHALEFGVYTGQSLNALAHAFPDDPFVGFDSFEGLPEAWQRSDDAVYGPGHFALHALPPVARNVTLVKGFFDASLGPWLADHPGPVRFIHEDPDLYSSAKYTLDRLTARIVDGTVIVFDELCDWLDSGTYPNWPDGEWKALCEWLAETGFKFRILARSFKYQAAIQVYRGPPPAFDSQRILAYATAFWNAGCRVEAIAVLEQRAAQKPHWAGGNYRLATWFDKVKDAGGVLRSIDRFRPVLDGKPDHPYAADIHRLLALAHYRLGDPALAYQEICAFLDRAPDNVGGLKIAGRCANACHRYEEAQAHWHRAAAFTGDRDCRKEACMAQWLSGVDPKLRSMKFSSLMVQHLIDDRQFQTVLDIGSGAGEQARALRDAGKTVTELDYGKSKYFVLNPDAGGAVIGDFAEVEISKQFDCAIASHVLEHQLNVGQFLRKLHAVVREGGVVAISVPPVKPQIVGGHVTLWNAGLLLYNLVLAGFDCSTPWVRRYGYNISVVIEKKTITPTDLEYDSGDVDRIRAFLPEGFREGFNGDIDELG